MWNSAFPFLPGVSTSSTLAAVRLLYSRLRWAAGVAWDVMPMPSTRQSRWLPARCPWGGLHQNIDTAANCWKVTPNRAAAINQSPLAYAFWAAESQHAGLPSRHVWAKTVFTQGSLNRERGADWKRKKRGPRLSKIDTRKAAYQLRPQVYFLFQQNLHLRHVLGIQPTLLICGKITADIWAWRIKMASEITSCSGSEAD